MFISPSGKVLPLISGARGICFQAPNIFCLHLIPGDLIKSPGFQYHIFTTDTQLFRLIISHYYVGQRSTVLMFYFDSSRNLATVILANDLKKQITCMNSRLSPVHFGENLSASLEAFSTLIFSIPNNSESRRQFSYQSQGGWQRFNPQRVMHVSRGPRLSLEWGGGS